MKPNIKDFQKKLGFSNPDLLKTVFVHRSYLNEHKNENLTSNERLEFLGDSILSFWVSQKLYLLYPHLPEGTLTNMRTILVRTETLAKIAEELKLGDFLLLSLGEEKSGGRKNKSLLANTFEALVGAIFLDQGLEKTANFLAKQFDKLIFSLDEKDLKDYKSLLQEKVQTKEKEPPQYKVLKEEGPDHNKLFVVGVFAFGKLIGTGKGRSKQEAEENAAKNALVNF